MAEVFCEDVESLVARVKRGDSDAFELLTERFLPLIRREVGRFFTGMDAEEACGEAYAALHSAAMHYEAGRGTTFGLYAKICLDRAMYAYSKSFPKDLYAEEAEEESAAGDPEAVIVREDGFLRMMAAVRGITSDAEYAVLRFYLQGYSEREIASLLGRTEKQVANAKARLFRKLRENAGELSHYSF